MFLTFQAYLVWVRTSDFVDDKVCFLRIQNMRISILEYTQVVGLVGSVGTYIHEYFLNIEGSKNN